MKRILSIALILVVLAATILTLTSCGEKVYTSTETAQDATRQGKLEIGSKKYTLTYTVTGQVDAHIYDESLPEGTMVDMKEIDVVKGTFTVDGAKYTLNAESKTVQILFEGSAKDAVINKMKTYYADDAEMMKALSGETAKITGSKLEELKSEPTVVTLDDTAMTFKEEK